MSACSLSLRCWQSHWPVASPHQPPPAASGPTTIKVLAMQQAGPTVEEMDSIVGEFNAANPDIKVEIEYVAYDALHDKIVTAMATNPPAYDVILVDDIWYAEFATNGYVLDVTDRLTPEMKDKVFQSAWDITTVDGKTYGMPWLLDAKYFYYNESCSRMPVLTTHHARGKR
ncbi:MAG: extracellular solute-binding protein [Anaerolineales bacterium]|nr:extracellular solute-binding protein [Anaerolineales bacterium]